MSTTVIDAAGIANRDASQRRIEESLHAIREKDIRSATIERVRIVWNADRVVEGLPQQIQIGEGLYYLLEHISVPVSPDDVILGRILEDVPDDDGEALLARTADAWKRGIPAWMKDGGHECFDWERLMRLGLDGLEDFAQKELTRRKASGASEESMDFLRGAVRIYQAFRNYARRYALAAREIGLAEAAYNCEVLAERPPETFAQALQLIWLVGIVYCTMVSMNPTLTFGRLDELLLDFYLADLDAERLTRDAAGVMIEDFYCKNNLVLGRGEHQMSSGTESDTGWLRNLTYDAPQYIFLGGYRKDGSVLAHELTTLCIERIVTGFENPVIVFRYTRNTPDHIWTLLCRKMRDNASILVYSDEQVIPAMIHSGIEEQDAVTYTMHGCNWPDIPGKEHQLGSCRILLPEHLLWAIVNGHPPKSIDELYERFASSVREVAETSFHNLREQRTKWHESSPGCLRIDDCFFDGPVANARSWTLGSLKYGTMLGMLHSIGTAADCVAAVDELVFSTAQVSMSDLRQALLDDYEGHESLRQLCLSAPKFGQDADRADLHAKRIIDTVTAIFDSASRKGTSEAVIATRCLETDMAHIRAGARLGATPDGRHAGQPLSENTSPYPGSCIHGITAMLNSVCKLPLNHINSGALNIRIQRALVRGDEGLSRLKSLLRAFFNEGGLQAQLSIADTEELLDAQVNPHAHRDLMVRITGYSAVFVDMCTEAQDEIIRRQEMGV